MAGEVPFPAPGTAGRTGREDEPPLAAAPDTPAATVLPGDRRAVSLAPRHRLGVPKGMGKKTGMLVLDPVVLDQWRTMNATEHYLYDFSFPGWDGSQVRAVCPYIEDAEAWTDDYSIGYLPLAEGQSMEFNYDYGTGWRVDVALEKVARPIRG